MSLFLIAEIGINHNGDLAIAKKLMFEARKAGFDAVKFQKRTIEKIYTKEFLDGPRESPWGTTQREYREHIEFGLDEYREIDRYSREIGIPWFASCWDVDSQHFVQQFNVPYNKIASALLGNWPLLREVAREKKKTFISTGMCTLEELDEVVDLFRSAGCPFELMHCVSTYPMKESDANLLCIPMLRQRYRCNVGYSGHETSLIKVCVAAVTLGASSLERHITLDRAMYGTDQAASISTHAADDFVESVRAIEGIMGTGIKAISPAEWEARRRLRIEAPREAAAPLLA